MKKILLSLLGLSVGIYLGALFYIGFHLYDTTAKPSDGILILGALSIHKDQLNPCLDERVKAGVELYKKGYAPKILMSGGIDRFGEKSQAEVMGELAQQYGVPRDAILLEKKSKNTYENITFTQHLLNEQGIESIIIVSDPYHLPRASLIADSLEISHTVFPALQSPCWSTYKFLGFDYFRDAAALISYTFTGKISLFP